GAPEPALGRALGAPLGAAGAQPGAGGKSGSAGDDLENAGARASFKIAVDVAAGFAPGAADGRALGDDVAGQIEFVGVAGAGQRLLQTISARTDRVGGAAPNSFGRAVIQRDRAAA